MRSTIDKEVEYNSVNNLEYKLEFGLVLCHFLRALEALLKKLQCAFVKGVRIHLFLAQEFLVILMHRLVNLIGNKFLGIIKVDESNALSIFRLNQLQNRTASYQDTD